jgi:hypothetical protein
MNRIFWTLVAILVLALPVAAQSNNTCNSNGCPPVVYLGYSPAGLPCNNGPQIGYYNSTQYVCSNGVVVSGGSTASSPFNVLSPVYGALGNGVHDDTTAFQAASAAACASPGSTLLIPSTVAGYIISGTIPLCSNLEVAGQKSLINYTGTGSLFGLSVLAQGVDIHSLNLVGTGTANTYAFYFTGVSGTCGNTFHIHDNMISGFGDVATGSGGGILNACDLNSLKVDNNIIGTNGTPFVSTGPTDALDIHDNQLSSGVSRCADFSGEGGAANVTMHDNSLICNSAARVTGPGTFSFYNNEFESTATITNTNAAAWEFLGTSGGPPIINAWSNYVALKNFGTYAWYFDGGTYGPVYSTFFYNRWSNTGTAGTQFGVYNGDVSGTNSFGYTKTYQPGASTYKFPTASNVTVWPLASGNLTDASNLLLASAQVGMSGGSPVKATNIYGCLDGYDHLPCAVMQVPSTLYSGTTTTGATFFAAPPLGHYQMCSYVDVVVAASTAASAETLTIYSTDGNTRYEGAVFSATTQWSNLSQNSLKCSNFTIGTTADQSTGILWELYLNTVTGTPTFRYAATLTRLQ